MRQSRSGRGFTLIEVMIVVVIIAVLSAIALPSYRNYVLRGKLVNATGTLSGGRARLEQFFQDYRTYENGPCPESPNKDEWTISCATADATTYKITATGVGRMDGFVFTIDQAGPATTKVPAAWGSVAGSPKACWVSRAGPSC